MSVDNQNPRPNVSDDLLLKTAKSQINVAFVFGPISLFLGGMLLGIVGVILGVLALRKISSLEAKQSPVLTDAQALRRSAYIAMGLCGVAIALNLVSFVVMYPTIVEMINSGQLDYLLPGIGTGSVSNSGSATSTWG